jgi:transglutaminase-like putative cysteine protease
MKFRVTHSTHYRYSEPVSLCHNVAHLRPRTTASQTCYSSQVTVSPSPFKVHAWEDLFGNQQDCFSVQEPHSELNVTALSEVEVATSGNLLDSAFPIGWEQALEHLRESGDPQVLDARQFTLESNFIEVSAEIIAYASTSFPARRPLLEAVHDLMQRIHRDFVFDPHFSSIATPLQQVLEHRRGVCQDFAHLAIACLRARGLAARYVSGYLETVPPPGEQKLRGADASHAWFAVYVPYQGWVDFDPTNDQIPVDRHITAAWGRDYADVAPLKGVLFGGGETHRLEVAVDVERI